MHLLCPKIRTKTTPYNSYILIPMQKIISFLETYGSTVLRYGMSAVILWFSFQQFMHNSVWTAYVPDSAVALTHLEAPALVFLNAVFELILGIALVFGYQVRIVALLLAVHLFGIMVSLGYGEIGTRDFGLAVAILVVSMNGPDALCIQSKKTQATTSTNTSL